MAAKGVSGGAGNLDQVTQNGGTAGRGKLGGSAIFSNHVTTLTSLSDADDSTLFSWSLGIHTSVATQGFDGNFLISATLDSGVTVAPPSVVPCWLEIQAIAPPTDVGLVPDASPAGLEDERAPTSASAP